MPLDVEYWDGHEWEEHILRLLQDRHGPENIQKVPATHGGDCGIDYFCLKERIVYQCYAVEEPVDVATRAKKQKSKITTDIGKFCDPDNGATRLFGDHPIKRWILVVPRHDSREVVQHAINKTAAIRAKGLPHVDVEFQVLIQDRDAFDEKSWDRRVALRERIRLVVSKPTDDEIAAVVGADQALYDNLRRKLGGRFGDEDSLDDAVNDALRVFVESQNAVESLRDSVPEAYEAVTRLVTERLRRLRLGSRGAGTADRLDTEIDGLKSSIIKAVPNLDPSTAETIAFGAVSEWLMRCPLRLD